MPANCDGCGAAANLEHDCKKRGLVTQRHNEVRDVIGDLASIAYKEVLREPIVQEAESVLSLITGLSIRGVWQPQTMALVSVCVTDTVARVIDAILSSAKEEKQRKYSEAFHQASFTPIFVSVDGVQRQEANFFIKHLARKLTSSGRNQTMKL